VRLPVRSVLEQAQVASAADLCAGERGDWLRLWPHRHQTDGFFAAVWQRKT